MRKLPYRNVYAFIHLEQEEGGMTGRVGVARGIKWLGIEKNDKKSIFSAFLNKNL